MNPVVMKLLYRPRHQAIQSFNSIYNDLEALIRG
jgi:hypothetical protein